MLVIVNMICLNLVNDILYIMYFLIYLQLRGSTRFSRFYYLHVVSDMSRYFLSIKLTRFWSSHECEKKLSFMWRLLYNLLLI